MPLVTGKPDATERLAALVEQLAERTRMNAAATKLPTEMGPIHFVGIGGIGMSGIAEVLIEAGLYGAGLRPEGHQNHRPSCTPWAPDLRGPARRKP